MVPRDQSFLEGLGSVLKRVLFPTPSISPVHNIPLMIYYGGMLGGIIYAIVLFLTPIVVTVSMMTSTCPWLLELGLGSKRMDSYAGVDYDKFYGTRVVYQDEQEANEELIAEYDRIIDKIIDRIELVTINGAGNIDITIPMPSSRYLDYAGEETIDHLAERYPKYHTLMMKMVGIVYEFDKQDPEFTPTTLSEYLSNIGHFGFSEDMIEPLQIAVYDYLNNNKTFVSQESASEPNETSLGSTIDYAVTSEINVDIVGQMDKLFIRDHIFTEEDKKMTRIYPNDYLYMIFMPKEDVAFNRFSFYAHGIGDDFDIKVAYNGNDIRFTREYAFDVEDEPVWLYKSDDGLNVDLPVQDYSGDLDLSKGMSLFDIVNQSEDVTKYLIDENGIYTVPKPNMYIEFTSNESFMFAEYETVLV